MCKKVLLVASLAVAGATNVLMAAEPPEVVAEQPAMETAFVYNVGPVVIGGVPGNERHAQTFQLGWAAVISHVMLPITCHPDAVLLVTIERTNRVGAPSGTVLVSQDVPGYALDGVASWRMIEFDAGTAPQLAPGNYAFTVSAKPAANGAGCSMWTGPVGDPYAGGNSYFSTAARRPVWQDASVIPGQVRDLAFQVYGRPR